LRPRFQSKLAAAPVAVRSVPEAANLVLVQGGTRNHIGPDASTVDNTTLTSGDLFGGADIDGRRKRHSSRILVLAFNNPDSASHTVRNIGCAG